MPLHLQSSKVNVAPAMHDGHQLQRLRLIMLLGEADSQDTLSSKSSTAPVMINGATLVTMVALVFIHLLTQKLPIVDLE